MTNSICAAICLSLPMRLGKCVWLYGCPLHIVIWIGSHRETKVSYFVLNFVSFAASAIESNTQVNERILTLTGIAMIADLLLLSIPTTFDTALST